VSRYQFYLGLLLALRAHRETFVADGPEFHSAFGKVQELAASKYVERLPWLASAKKDPAFGVWREASDMLLEGMNGILLFFSNDWRKAFLRISQINAVNELEEYGPDAAILRDLALEFHNALP
jgi:hypothetical protein